MTTLFSPYLQPEVLGITEVMPGHLLHWVWVEGLTLYLINVYAPASGPDVRLALFLDHHLGAMMASLSSERPGLAYRHFNNSLLEDVEFVASFREFWLAWWDQRHAFPSARQWWAVGKVRARPFCHGHTQGASRQRYVVIEQLEREVLELGRHLATSPGHPPLCGAYQEKREELHTLDDLQARGAFIRSRIHFLWEMDRDLVEMHERARAFSTGLFSPVADACGVLWDELSTVSTGDRDRLELPLTLAEFSEALHFMPTNKSPGMNGLTVEFYCMFWDVLG
ncbi:unnamed protein product [Caretta caretta]